MIRDLLGNADQTRPNPYSSNAPIRLWSLRRIEEVEASPGFAQRQAAGKRRSAVSASAADRKREELLDQIHQIPVSVPLMNRDKVIRRACEHRTAGSPRLAFLSLMAKADLAAQVCHEGRTQSSP